MARKKPPRDSKEVDLDVLRAEFRKVGADRDLAKAILDLAQSSSYGLSKAFDDAVEEHRLAKVQELSVPEAENVLRRDYFEDVNHTADEIIRSWNDGEFDDVHDAIHQAVDSRQRVIYTHQARLGMAFTEHADAYTEEFGEPPVRDGDIAWEALMYAAMREDVVEALERKGFDVNDPPGPEEDEEDED